MLYNIRIYSCVYILRIYFPSIAVISEVFCKICIQLRSLLLEDLITLLLGRYITLCLQAGMPNTLSEDVFTYICMYDAKQAQTRVLV